MCESVVLQVGVVQDVPLDTVVGGEITEVDQSCSPDIWPAASPQSKHPGLLQHFPGKYFYIKIKNYPSQSVLSLTLRHPSYRELGEVCQEVAFFPPSVSESLSGPWVTPSVAQYLEGHSVNTPPSFSSLSFLLPTSSHHPR